MSQRLSPLGIFLFLLGLIFILVWAAIQLFGGPILASDATILLTALSWLLSLITFFFPPPYFQRHQPPPPSPYPQIPGRLASPTPSPANPTLTRRRLLGLFAALGLALAGAGTALFAILHKSASAAGNHPTSSHSPTATPHAPTATESVPGKTWRIQDSGTSQDLSRVAWSGSQYVVVGKWARSSLHPMELPGLPSMLLAPQQISLM